VAAWWISTIVSAAGLGGNPPWEDVQVPKDRRQDRHSLPARIIRPNPAELWAQLGSKVGERRRSAVVSELIRRYLAGEIELDESEDDSPAEA
jgi:hypothetical protein